MTATGCGASSSCNSRAKKNKEKKRRENEVSGTGGFASDSMRSILTTDHAGTDGCKRSGRKGSNVLTVKEKNGLKSSNEGIDVTIDGGRKKPKKDDQGTGLNLHSQQDVFELYAAELASANDMFVEMPVAEKGSHRKKYKRKKGRDRLGIDLLTEDGVAGQKQEPDTVLCGEKTNKKNNNVETWEERSPNKEPIGLGLPEQLRQSPTRLTECSAHSTNGTSIMENYSECGIIQGKRFSKEEDEIIRVAVSQYIEQNKLGKDGIRKLLYSRKYCQVRKGRWAEIAACIPWRLPTAVRQRAVKLFLNDVGHKWTPEEIEFVQTYVREHGNRWTAIGEHLGVSSVQAYRAWTRYRNPDFRLGSWGQEECQQLFDLVHNDLKQIAFHGKNDKSGMTRENISWTTISEEMNTRHMFSISKKWYRSLTSSMVAQGLWSEVDDYYLVDNLLKLDACCVEDVDWENLVSNRSGAICRKRWFEMARNIGGKVEIPFMEQVELLSTRYRMDMLEYRERALKKRSSSINR